MKMFWNVQIKSLTIKVITTVKIIIALSFYKDVESNYSIFLRIKIDNHNIRVKDIRINLIVVINDF